ncbi:hypothetical protein EJB05_05179 [Eragrostis curvula]|uniref:RRM domain-containing protein n=1 Tax=Eragrostis curvula TaxID=38414 RepID=A0A5J9WCF0_9POAL|nr:hypothetical protein EJB05_05179 [Eragrostis curvula]
MAATGQTQIFVGGLAWQTDDRRLEEAFRPFGRVIHAQVINNKETGASRGFGFVTFEDPWEAANAVKEMHYQELDGRLIEVYYAKTSYTAVVVGEDIAVARTMAIEAVLRLNAWSIALNVMARVIWLVIVLLLMEVASMGSPHHLAAAVAGETEFLDHIMTVAITGIVAMSIMDMIAPVDVMVMDIISTPLVLIGLVLRSMEAQVVLVQVVTVGLEEEAMKEIRCVSCSKCISLLIKSNQRGIKWTLLWIVEE